MIFPIFVPRWPRGGGMSGREAIMLIISAWISMTGWAFAFAYTGYSLGLTMDSFFDSYFGLPCLVGACGLYLILVALSSIGMSALFEGIRQVSKRSEPNG